MQPNIHKARLIERFDHIARDRDAWRQKNKYYHQSVIAFLRFLIPDGQKVLMLGSSTGDILAALHPSEGVGIDISSRMVEIASHRYPQYTFIQGDAEDPATWGKTVRGPFDFIVLPALLGHLEDIQQTFENLHAYCDGKTRLVLGYYNFLWEPVLKVGEKLRLKMPQRTQNWLSPEDIGNLLDLADFEVVKTDRKLLVPKKIPLLHRVVEAVGSLPGINRLCINNYIVARRQSRRNFQSLNVSIVIPCRNEKGNIEEAIRQIPEFGRHQEIIFVEGHSQDGTLREIKRIQEKYPEKDIKWFVQPGKGKADATWTGFDNASGDILMILDGDLTVPPKDLPKFYRAIVADKGEFVNGSRLVYPLEEDSMRLLNTLGNKFFSLVFTWLLNQRIKDTLCGTKVISRENYIKLRDGRSYFGDFDPFGDFDLLFGAAKLNLRIREVPIRYRARSYGETQIKRFSHGLLLLRMTVFAARKLKLI